VGLLHPLTHKLQRFAPLSEADRLALQANETFIRHLPDHEDVVREDDAPDRINVMVEGMAHAYKLLPNGRRQIMAYFLPGDICDPALLSFDVMDHSVATNSVARIGVWSRQGMLNTMEHHPLVMRALRVSFQLDAAIAREWLANLGQRSASERLAHLLCELFHRLRVIGATKAGECFLPITQSEFADTLGLSAVHVNRTLQELRRLGLVQLSRNHLAIHDLDGLCELAMFNAGYLGLGTNLSSRTPPLPAPSTACLQ
jgi:CRP-like cAMP-binding protein